MKSRNHRIKIICYHLLNDYTGSTNILSANLAFLASKGVNIDVYSSFNNDGFLSEVNGINKINVYYKFTKSKFYRLVLFVIAQIRYFFSLFKYSFSKDVTVYVNTILPFGATIGAFFLRKRIVYHIHEYPINRSVINRLGMFIATNLATKLIFVSNYVQESFGLTNEKRSCVIRNYISERLLVTSADHTPQFNQQMNILMICSLRVYKGVDVFVELARKLPNHRFTLIVSADNDEIESYFSHQELPSNLLILPTQKDLQKFYSTANLCLNLSIPDQCIETFGLTVLEATAYGLPAIVPPVGGVTEIIEDGKNGFLVDPRDITTLTRTINEIATNETLYYKLSTNGKAMAKRFNRQKSFEKLEEVINAIGK
ncbi:glycosyltransferase family 4 protein [Parapedobacter indicus]|uniref:Glycosyltransferase involved in cell wall bisynthesis n=1 Tax=Parapedobacter indicus TaxID=1477437 RepID=A0A1I3TE78_9SPHI|nr:glycosyltransferase family 4 protein [Parapedobacter indicus]PPK99536.1 glycosyltransferase involved in cell wall biosynthesis [Parapedobacter indicus]SFJ68803.1 Glycosyltransferase involved in cell wall bisynthesis [Parapedobacter indicus]